MHWHAIQSQLVVRLAAITSPPFRFLIPRDPACPILPPGTAQSSWLTFLLGRTTHRPCRRTCWQVRAAETEVDNTVEEDAVRMPSKRAMMNT